MRSISPQFLLISIALIAFSSCTTFKTVQNSGALNTMAIELDDENVQYTRLESPFDRRTFGGFLKGASSTNTIEASVIHNNNGNQTSNTSNFFGSSILQAVTLVGSAIYWYQLVEEGTSETTNNDDRLFNPLTAVFSAFLGLVGNEAAWRPFNGARIQREAFNATMKQDPDADFYSFPYAEFEIAPGLLGTQWSGTQRIVAGNISNELFQSRGNVSSRSQVEKSEGKVEEEGEKFQEPKAITEEARVSENREPTPSVPNVPTVRGKQIVVGSTGRYKYSKNDFRKFQVLEILDFKGGDQFRVRVIIESPPDNYTTTFKASNKSLIFD